MIDVPKSVEDSQLGKLLNILKVNLVDAEFNPSYDYKPVKDFVENFAGADVTDADKQYLALALMSTKGTRLCINFFNSDLLNIKVTQLTYKEKLQLFVTAEIMESTGPTASIKYFTNALYHLLYYRLLDIAIDYVIHVINVKTDSTVTMEFLSLNYQKSTRHG